MICVQDQKQCKRSACSSLHFKQEWLGECPIRNTLCGDIQSQCTIFKAISQYNTKGRNLEASRREANTSSTKILFKCNMLQLVCWGQVKKWIIPIFVRKMFNKSVGIAAGLKIIKEVRSYNLASLTVYGRCVVLSKSFCCVCLPISISGTLCESSPPGSSCY